MGIKTHGSGISARGVLGISAAQQTVAQIAALCIFGRMNPRTSASFHRIKSLAIIGGFLDGLRIGFADGLNCIIGARGTGKTTILELIRYAMDALPKGEASPASRRRIEGLISKNLDGGRVELEVETMDGLDYVISRADGEEPVVLDARRSPTAISIRNNGLFRADIYSQNDVETIADQGRYQLDLIDGFEAGRIANLDYTIHDIRQHLAASAKSLDPLRRKLAVLDEELKKLPDIEDRLKGMAAGADGDNEEINQAHAAKARRDRETRALRYIGQQMSDMAKNIEAMTGNIRRQIAPLLGREFTEGGNAPLFAPLAAALEACADAVDGHLRGALGQMEGFSGVLQEQGEKLAVAHQEQELAFRTLIEKHREHQSRSVERTNLERLRNGLLEQRREREETVKRIVAVESERVQLLDRLSELRDERFSLRQEVSARLSAALAPEIRVSIRQHGDAAEYQALIEDSLRGQGIRQGLVAQKLVRSLTPVQLTAIVRAGDTQALVERADLNPDQAAKVIAAFSGEMGVCDLETVELRDDPSIELKDGAEYKKSSALSTGQKCTTILPILLLDNENPLLVDQPEDNLDNRFIFQTVVANIHKVKPTRQLIFVTHNPNIPVLGEASRVFVMESDGEHGVKASEGTVDECKQNIVTLLEGGEDAFRKRGERYNF